MAKAAPIVLKLKSLLSDKAISHVADFAILPVKESLEIFKNLQVEAEACLKKNGAVSINIDADKIDAVGKAATERTNLLSKMVDVARKRA